VTKSEMYWLRRGVNDERNYVSRCAGLGRGRSISGRGPWSEPDVSAYNRGRRIGASP
jgi:hypothetical protein